MEKDASRGKNQVTAEMIRNLPEAVQRYMAFNAKGGPRP
jgi:hypothetical protein